MRCFGWCRISYEDFLAAILSAPCRTLSGRARPSECEVSYRYHCQLAKLVQKPVYPVWFVNEGRTEFRNYGDPEACPIRIEELAALHRLICPILDQWRKSDKGPIVEPSVITLHCSGCDRRVLIDGVHRILWLLQHGPHAMKIHITELSGSRWPVDTPDLNVICTCTRK